ncbi:MAG: NAD-dependent epimerase/dehydratase family protein [Clostridiales bacterium]|nr:NAD-dependent epimerase/dehydratase family protein [Clostridiales bacterium]
MYSEYLVTGGAGALGKLIIGMLLEQGAKVRILMSEKADVSEYLDADVKICYGISTDKESMMDFFDLEDPRHSVLIHADEYISMSPESNLIMRRVNVTGAQNIVDMCLKRKVGRLVYLGSAYALDSSVKGEGVSIHFNRNKAEGDYAKTKAEAAAYILEKVALNRLNAVMVLPTFIIGPGYSQDYEINKILNSYLKGVHPVKGGGHAFVDVRDVATAMVSLTEEGEPGSGYIISGEYKTSMEFFEKVNEIEGIDAPIKTASRLLMSKPLSKFVDAYYRRTHKDNPKHIYALFQDNPDTKYEGTGAMYMNDGNVDFGQSISDSIDFLKTGTMPEMSMADLAADTAAGPAERGSATAAIVAARKATEDAKEEKKEESKPASEVKPEAEDKKEEEKVNKYAPRTTFFTRGVAEGKVDLKKEEKEEDKPVEEEIKEEEAVAETAEEVVEETVENIEDTAVDVVEEAAEATEEAVEELAEETTEEVIEEVAEEATEAIEETVEEVEEAVEEAPVEAAEEIIEEVPEAEEVTEEIVIETEEAVEEIAEEPALEITEEVAETVEEETEEVVSDAEEIAAELTEEVSEEADLVIEEEAEVVIEEAEEVAESVIEEAPSEDLVVEDIEIPEAVEETVEEAVEETVAVEEPAAEEAEQIIEEATEEALETVEEEALPTLNRPIWETMPPIENPDDLLLDLDDLDDLGGDQT